MAAKTREGGVANPAAATEAREASGAIIEPEITAAIDVSHESVDNNPRAGTTAEQNAVDWNDAKRARPTQVDYAGQGVDLTVYGAGALASEPGEIPTGAVDEAQVQAAAVAASSASKKD